MTEVRSQKTVVRGQKTDDRLQKSDFGIWKWDPASFCWSQNYAAASDAEVGILKYGVLFQKKDRSPSFHIRPSIFDICPAGVSYTIKLEASADQLQC